jgi:GntR family transcriptional repressor for pyruvate dehydrogenase complex
MDKPKELLTPIKSQKVYTQIVDQIIKLIDSGEYKHGMQLAPERDLARQLGVSRGSLREALTVLQMMGLIEARPGQGTFIGKKLTSELYSVDVTRILDEESPLLILEARKAFEPSVAALTAERCSALSLEKLEDIIRSVQKDLSPVSYAEGDRLFHLELAIASENSALIQMQTFIYSLMGQDLWRTIINYSNYSSRNRWQAGLSEHLKILESIRKKDSIAAEKFVRDHLQMVEQVMVEPGLSYTAGNGNA